MTLLTVLTAVILVRGPHPAFCQLFLMEHSDSATFSLWPFAFSPVIILERSDSTTFSL